ncbi:Hypothetical protein D9617_7g030320 [Elsinoe fawcettii]|nr:Hypothetical protein D9617_7g030320 [Elsinoe fawcettii]
MPHLANKSTTGANLNGHSLNSNTPVSQQQLQQRHTTATTPPLPRAPSDALSGQDSSVIDSRTASDPRQRLLHSRFPSLNRIRSRKKAEDTFAQQRASSNSISTDDAPSSPRSPQSPVLSFNSTTTAPDPDGDKAFASLSIESQPSRSSSHHRQKPSSVYSSDSTELLPRQEQAAPRRSTTKSPAPTGSTDDWSEKPKTQPNKAVNMHQTSSRLLRMTDDDRPFTRVSPRHTPFIPITMHNQSFGGQTYFNGPEPPYPSSRAHLHIQVIATPSPNCSTQITLPNPALRYTFHSAPITT